MKMNSVQKVIEIGDGLGVIIPVSIVKLYDLKVGDSITVTFSPINK